MIKLYALKRIKRINRKKDINIFGIKYPHIYFSVFRVTGGKG